MEGERVRGRGRRKGGHVASPRLNSCCPASLPPSFPLSHLSHPPHPPHLQAPCSLLGKADGHPRLGKGPQQLFLPEDLVDEEH
jgi:hypothetical protein